MGGATEWTPITCARTSVLYVAFDGDLRTRLRRLDAVLAAQGWIDRGGASDTLSRSTPSPAVPQQPDTRPPTCLQKAYTPAPQQPATARGWTAATLVVSVAEYPCRPSVPTGDAQVVGPPEKSSGEGVLYLEWRPLWTRTVTDRAYAAHRYVAVFSLTDHYAVQSPATRSPSAAR